MTSPSQVYCSRNFSCQKVLLSLNGQGSTNCTFVFIRQNHGTMLHDSGDLTRQASEFGSHILLTRTRTSHMRRLGRYCTDQMTLLPAKPKHNTFHQTLFSRKVTKRAWKTNCRALRTSSISDQARTKQQQQMQNVTAFCEKAPSHHNNQTHFAVR